MKSRTFGRRQTAAVNHKRPTNDERPLKLSAFLRYVRKIPTAKVATYGQIAYAAGYPGAARQVAWALHKSRGLPWHRVVGAGGRILLGGELGLEQRLRLEAEGVTFRGLRVRMDLHQAPFSHLKQRKKNKS